MTADLVRRSDKRGGKKFQDFSRNIVAIRIIPIIIIRSDLTACFARAEICKDAVYVTAWESLVTIK